MPELPKIADAPLSIVLLAPHAGDPVDLAVHDWLGWLGQRPGEAEVLVVLPDAESTRSQGVASGDPRVRIVRHVAPPGNGAFLQSAAALVRYPLLLTATADRQFQPADASRLLAQIDHVHMVCGCRVAAPPFWLRALGWMKRMVTRVLLGYADEPRATWLGWPGLWRRVSTRLIFGVKLHDAACVLRLYRTEVLRRFPIQSTGSFAHVEVVAKANHLGCWMAEVPVSWAPSDSPDADPCWSADVKTLRRRPQFTL